MLHEVMVVTVGTLLGLTIRGLFFAAVWNTKVWLESKVDRCLKCDRENPELLVKYAGDLRRICEDCARADFDMTFEEAVQRGIIRRKQDTP